MATASDIISRAQRLIGILDAGQAMQADEAQDALDTLNAMLAEMYEAGFGFPQYSFATLTTEQDTDAADREALSYALALRMAPEYGVSVTPEIASVGQQAMYRLRSRYFVPSHPIPSCYF